MIKTIVDLKYRLKVAPSTTCYPVVGPRESQKKW